MAILVSATHNKLLSFMSDKRSTFSIIGDRYLDTQHDSSYIASLEGELKSRGIVGLKRVVFEYIAASSLWWNILWWELWDLDENDMKVGWFLNIPFFLVPAIIIGVLYNLLGFLLTVLVLHSLTLIIGLGLRVGTKQT